MKNICENCGAVLNKYGDCDYCGTHYADINDTFNSSDEDYKIKYEEEVKGRAEDNKNWAVKYRDTFFNPKAKEELENIDNNNDENNEEEYKQLTFDMLFK